MFRKISDNGVIKNSLLIILGMMIATMLFGERPFSSQTASADTEMNIAPLEQNSPTGQTWITCVPNDIANFNNRVHVRCAAPVGNIWYFAAPTNNAAHAARVLSTLSAAQIAGRTLDILYDPDDTSGDAYGCLAADCRLIVAVGFGQ